MEKHVLGISGGKDSAALAIYMAQKYPELDIDYFFLSSPNKTNKNYILSVSISDPVLEISVNSSNYYSCYYNCRFWFR